MRHVQAPVSLAQKMGKSLGRRALLFRTLQAQQTQTDYGCALLLMRLVIDASWQAET